MRTFVNRCIWEILDTLFPPHCTGCEKWGVRLCDDCFRSIRRIKDPVCDCCGEPLYGFTENLCTRCKSSSIYIDHIRSWAIFEGVLKKSIHKLKYHRDIGLGMILAQPMISYLKKLDWHVDLIIPVPLDKERVKSRGYNQASLLAKPISYDIGVRFNSNCLTRFKTTKSQVGLSMSQRTENVKGAFRSGSLDISGLSILLIDDVVTTGSTLNSCADALKECGAKVVYGLTLARSLRL